MTHILAKSGLVASVILSTLLFSFPLMSDACVQQEKWEQLSLEADYWVDCWRLPIDSGIKEAVIALHAMGVATTVSSQGYADHDFFYPWIDVHFTTPEVLVLEKQQEALIDLIYDTRDRLEYQFSYLSEEDILVLPEAEDLRQAYAEDARLEEAIKTIRDMQFQHLSSLLDQFYQQPHFSYEAILFLYPFDQMHARLQSIGAEFQEYRSNKEQIEHYQIYLTEMERFAAFLKELFLTSERNPLFHADLEDNMPLLSSSLLVEFTPRVPHQAQENVEEARAEEVGKAHEAEEANIPKANSVKEVKTKRWISGWF